MGLEAVVGDIKEKGRKEVTAIQAETGAEVRRILSEAQEIGRASCRERV